MLLPALFIDVGQWLLMTFSLLIFRIVFARYLRRRLGGYSGDALGAAQQLSELLIYLSLLVAL